NGCFCKCPICPWYRHFLHRNYKIPAGLASPRAKRPLCYRHPAGAVIPRPAGAPMRRREFITLIGGAAAWPMAARAQQGPGGIRRVAVLMGIGETASSRSWLAALFNRLDELGWREGRNLVTQVQWWHDQPEQMRLWAADLLARSPDVVVTF